MMKYPLYVTLDTNIFVANKYDFSENSTLELLAKYVASNKIKVVMSDIVIKEVEKHIAAEGNKICGALRKLRADVLKTSSEEFLVQVGLHVPLQIIEKKQCEEKSRNAWKEFVASLNPEILDTSLIDLDAILDDYFSFNPPFENSDRKRKEFPDAFIANQIRQRFGKEQVVAIISDDNGFIRACGNSENHIFYRTLGELYDAINRQDAEYQRIVQKINLLVAGNIFDIESFIKNNECIEVYGRAYDEDRIPDGFGYSDIEVMSIRKITCSVRTIDEIAEEMVRATLLCTADIDVECSYEDYDNAVWDREANSYYFIETCKNLERHSARFGIRIEVDRETKNLKIVPFKVILNRDTLLDWFEIDEDDNEIDIVNQDREDIGFRPLDRYSDYLEDDLSDSFFMTSVISIFDKINSLYREYEEIATLYDDLVVSIKESKSKEAIKQLAIMMDDMEMFPMPFNLDEITDEEVDEVVSWANQSYDRLSEFSEQSKIPDSFNYGDTIEICNGEEVYKFVIDQLIGIPTAGDQELIDLSIIDNAGIVIANGYVSLTVGYLDFDEDGGAGDGIEDDIEYYCEDIVNALESIAKSISENVEKEWVVAKRIETVI